MKALLCKAFGPPESLTVEETPPPQPQAGEVLIDVHAAGVNFADTLKIEGRYQEKPPFPFSPGGEVAGVIAALGPGVTRHRVGDRVMACTGRAGGFAEQTVALEDLTFRLPDAMPFRQAAGFPVAYGTSWFALVDRGHLQPGEVLLVHGATGGAGLTAVEVGKQLGATVIGSGGSAAKLAVAQGFGADHVIDYSRDNIRDRVKELTGGRGADVIYDAVGGDAFDQSLRCIAWNGRLLVIGFASGRIPAAPANIVMLKNCAVIGVNWPGHATHDIAAYRRGFETMLHWVAEGRLKPHVSMDFSLADSAQALRALLDRRQTGKIVITVREEKT
jgi:NADPH2:quinone reductase